MAINNPTQVQHAANLLNALNFYHRNGQYPLDDTSVWSTIADFEQYLTQDGSYRYPGQLVAITNGDAYDASNDKDVSLVLVRANGTKQIVGAETIHESLDAANAWVQANPNVAIAGKVVTVKNDTSYQVYVINPDKSLSRISFETSDVPAVTWANLQDKPESLVTEIDAAVALSKKFAESDGKLSYNAKPLAFVEDIPTEYAAAKITGIINIENLPAAVQERLSIVTDNAALLALTEKEVQNGDSVKVTKFKATDEDTEHMALFFVKDSKALGTMDAFEEYSVGAAASVPWSGVTGKPTKVAESGLTDAVATGDTSVAPVAGKVVKYNASSKLDGTAADADKFGGQLPEYYTAKTDFDAEVTARGEAETAIKEAATALTERVTKAETDIGTANDNITAINGEITKLKSGATITELDVSKLKGVIDRTNLPVDVSGKLISVASTTEMAALTTEQVHQGDFVQVAGGALYICNVPASIGTADAYVKVVDITGSTIAWDQITGKPTTIDEYGITDAVNKSQLSNKAEAGKVAVYTDEAKIDGSITGDAKTLDSHGVDYFATATDLTSLTDKVGDATKGLVKDIADLQSGETVKALDAAKLTGKIALDLLPATAIERLKKVKNHAAMLALTIKDVQNGDSVKDMETGKMYFVVDETLLGQDTAFEEYTVGTAGAVNWTGVQNHPTTIAGYGITDAVNSNEKVSEASAANAGKILVLNADGKLDVSITGNVAWANVLNKPESTVTEIDAAVKTATHTNRAVLDELGDDGKGRLTYKGAGLATKAELDTVSINTLAQSSVAPADAAVGQLWLEPITE